MHNNNNNNNRVAYIQCLCIDVYTSIQRDRLRWQTCVLFMDAGSSSILIYGIGPQTFEFFIIFLIYNFGWKRSCWIKQSVFGRLRFTFAIEHDHAHKIPKYKKNQPRIIRWQWDDDDCFIIIIFYVTSGQLRCEHLLTHINAMRIAMHKWFAWLHDGTSRSTDLICYDDSHDVM